MATTRIISMHVNRGKTIAQCLADRTDYAENPEKTESGKLISAFECDPKTVDAEFLFSKRQYKTITGREQKNDVIAYQIRQSFKPGEVTPQQANEIGYELATRFLKGRHAFIVCTHCDKSHIHSHIIFNSTSLDCKWKFRDFLGSGRAIARLSDTICLEHGFSIVENPKHHSKSYNKWLGDQAKPSNREFLRVAIDMALAQKPADFDALLKLLRDSGYEVKAGKILALRGKNQNRFIRLDTLGSGYSEAELRAVLSGEKTYVPRKKAIRPAPDKKVNLLVDIQAKLRTGKGVRYERWAKVFNLKQMAQTVNYLTEHNLLEYDALAAQTALATTRYNELSAQIKAAEKRLAEIAVLKTQIINYAKTRDTYVAYRKAGYSKKFLREHESDILLHKAAKKSFDELGVKKLPTVKSLQAEYAVLLAEKKEAYADYRKARDEIKELLTVKANVDHLLGTDRRGTEKEKEHEQR